MESGRFAPADPNASIAHRTANPDSTCPDSIGIGIPHVNRGDIPIPSGTRSIFSRPRLEEQPMAILYVRFAAHTHKHAPPQRASTSPPILL